MSNVKERNQYVDFLRGFAILMVVMGHTMTGSTLQSEDSFLFNVIWSLQMPLFFLISGYVTRYSRKIRSGNQLLSLIKRRSEAYLLPWLVWTVLVKGFVFESGFFTNAFYLFWHMDTGYWFLFSIWTINVLHAISQYVAAKIIKSQEDLRGRIKFAVAEGAAYVGSMCLLLVIGLAAGLGFLCIKLTLYYMPFYFAGCLFGAFQEDLKCIHNSESWKDGAVAVCAVVWLIILTRVNLYRSSGVEVLFRVTASLTGCVAMVGLLQRSCERKGKWFRAFHWCGIHSLEIYLAHYLMLNLLKPQQIPVFNSMVGMWSVFANYAFTLLLVCTSVWLLNQNRYLRFFLFGKK